MSEFGVQAAALSEAIHVGRMNAAKTEFAEKQDRTDMVLAAVGDYVRRNFNGGMTADFPGMGFVLTVKVEPLPETSESEPEESGA